MDALLNLAYKISRRLDSKSQTYIPLYLPSVYTSVLHFNQPPYKQNNISSTFTSLTINYKTEIFVREMVFSIIDMQ